MASILLLRALGVSALSLGTADLAYLNAQLVANTNTVAIAAAPTTVDSSSPTPTLSPTLDLPPSPPPSLPLPLPPSPSNHNEPPAIRQATIYFADNSARFDPSRLPTVGSGPVTLEGHTDYRGPESFNAGLRWQRANAVRDELVRRGVPRDRITVTVAPPSQHSAEPWRDRRVSITFAGGPR